MGTPTEGLARLRATTASGALDGVCERLGLELLVVFGSTVDPDPLRPPDDLDIAVRLCEESTAGLVDVANALVDLTGTSRVDVLDLAAAGVVARARALGPPAEALFEATPGAFALAQMAALSQAMETAPMRRRALELLAER